MAVKRKSSDTVDKAEIEAPSEPVKQTKLKSLSELESEDEDEEEGKEKSDADDSEEDEGDSEDDEELGDEEHQKKSSSSKGLSAEEVQVARETSELFKSNIFKMQIDELMEELKLNNKQVQLINKLLYQVHQAIENNLPEKATFYSLSETEQLFAGKKKTNVIPFPDPKPPKDVKYKFGFVKPDYITVLGSYSLHTAVKQPEGVGIDLYVNMPSDLFQAKDYLNYRYIHKRAFYLACLAMELQDVLPKKLDKPMEISYAYLNEDLLRPVIELSPKQSSKKFSIRIIPGTSSKTFENRKLGPDRNCVRLDREDTSTLPPTVFYNSSVLSDTSYRAYSEFLHRAKKSSDGFTEACILGRLWLRQRGFGSSIREGGFGHFEWAMLMASLLNGSGGQRVLMAGYSSYQLFKATLKFLSTQKSLNVSFGSESATKANDKNLDFFTAPAKLFDRDLKLNVLCKVSGWSFNILKHEAAVTSDLLTDVVKDRFDSVLLKNISNPNLRFDTTFSISFESGPFLPEDKLKYVSYKHYMIEKLYRALTRGYGNRIKQIGLFEAEKKNPFSLNKRRESGSNNEGTVLVGLLLDPQECEKVMTHGPSAEDEEESERFRRFWGKKSELRRFQDGRIAESVVWEANSNKLIVHTIAEYLLDRHFNESNPRTKFDHDIVNKFLPQPTGNTEISITNTKLFTAKINAFQKLANALQEIPTNSIPLRIKTVSAMSTSLRYTSIHQPLPFDLDGDNAVGIGILEFESSSRWPDDLTALEKTKTAFLLKISEQLDKSPEYTSFVGIDENYVKPGVEVGFLEVQTKDGFMFRLRVASERDYHLYKKAELAVDYEKKYHGAIAHHRMVHRLALRFPFYSPAVRLLKQWFSSHLLLGSQINEEAVELLALIPFLDSSPYIPPSSAVTAFYRVLDFISNWNWRDEGVYLDVEKSRDVTMDDGDSNLLTTIEGTRMSQALYQELQTAFASRKENDPALTLAPLFIGTKQDATGILWTRQTERSEVGKVIASRITALCRAGKSVSDKTKLFTPSYSDYDMVINIKDPHAVSNSAKSQFKNLQTHFPSLDKTVNIIANVPEMFFYDLKEKYKHSLILFYSPNHKPDIRRPSENAITGIWHRDLIGGGRKFKVNLDYSTIPQDDASDIVELNKPSIVEEIKRIGGDLVVNMSYK